MNQLFEWDERKNEANIAKHGIGFRLARKIFDSAPFHVYESHPGNDRSRFVAVGEAEGILMAVVYTHRGDAIRIISARKARNDEKDAYRSLLQRAFGYPA